MRRTLWFPSAVAAAVVIAAVAALMLLGGRVQAQPPGPGNEAMQRMMAQQRAPQPQLLLHENRLFVLDREWLFQFDAQTLELKSMQNLDLLRHEFMQKMQKEGRLPPPPQGQNR